jgi:hypothetical protein
MYFGCIMVLDSKEVLSFPSLKLLLWGGTMLEGVDFQSFLDLYGTKM